MTKFQAFYNFPEGKPKTNPYKCIVGVRFLSGNERVYHYRCVLEEDMKKIISDGELHLVVTVGGEPRLVKPVEVLYPEDNLWDIRDSVAIEYVLGVVDWKTHQDRRPTLNKIGHGRNWIDKLRRGNGAAVVKPGLVERYKREVDKYERELEEFNEKLGW